MCDWREDYRRLTRQAASFAWCRSAVRMTGGDALRVLQGLCTNDVLKLAEGEACEAFLCTAQGKIQGHVVILRTRDGAVLDAPGRTGRDAHGAYGSLRDSRGCHL